MRNAVDFSRCRCCGIWMHPGSMIMPGTGKSLCLSCAQPSARSRPLLNFEPRHGVVIDLKRYSRSAVGAAA